MKSTGKNLIQTILIPLAILLLVWVCLEHAVDSPLILPGPAAVLQRAWQLIQTASFRAQLYATLSRVLASFVITVLLSVVLGAVQAFIPAVERLLRIPMTFIKTAPVVSFILIALFWFTTGTVPVFVAVLMTLPVVTSSVYKGLTGTDAKLLAMCRVYGFSRWQKLVWCYVPSALPVFSASAVTAFAQTWKVVVAAEVISLPQKSLGTAMQTAKVHLETADVFAITLVLVTVSFALESVFRALVSWRPGRGRGNEMLNRVQHDGTVIPNLIRDPVSVVINRFSIVRGGRVVYSGFSHTFPAGSVTALAAPSGAGKTTLLDYVAGLTNHTVSYIFQEPRLLPALNVTQNIAAPLYRTMGKSAAIARARQLLEQVGLGHKAAARVTELSGGEKQRVALARAFAYPAPVLLMDEAFQSQDVHLRLQLLQLFEQLQTQSGRTVIMATHDIKEALTLADTILVLKPVPGTGITEPELNLPLIQNRACSARHRYLTGNAELEQKILQILL